jgi:hypothetical protein
MEMTGCWEPGFSAWFPKRTNDIADEKPGFSFAFNMGAASQVEPLKKTVCCGWWVVPQARQVDQVVGCLRRVLTRIIRANDASAASSLIDINFPAGRWQRISGKS